VTKSVAPSRAGHCGVRWQAKRDTALARAVSGVPGRRWWPKSRLVGTLRSAGALQKLPPVQAERPGCGLNVTSVWRLCYHLQTSRVWCPRSSKGRDWSLDILHANGVRAYQPKASEERAPPWENRRIISTRPARAGAASVPEVTLIECHLIALQQRSEFCLKSDLRPCRAQEPS